MACCSPKPDLKPYGLAVTQFLQENRPCPLFRKAVHAVFLFASEDGNGLTQMNLAHKWHRGGANHSYSFLIIILRGI
jgi:hypothetical protein